MERSIEYALASLKACGRFVLVGFTSDILFHFALQNLHM